MPSYIKKVNVSPDPNKNNIDVKDNGYSNMVLNQGAPDVSEDSAIMDTYFSSLKHSVGLFDHDEIDLINNRYRFGINTPSDDIHTVKEYLFFTKPDLYIYPNRKDGTLSLNQGLRNQPYWLDLLDKNPEIFYCLQDSLSIKNDHFNHLLGNMVQSNLSIPSLSAEMIDTPTNLYGVGYQYHGSAEASDDMFDFTLEFRDVKGLPVYHFFRAYEDYQTLKYHGVLETNIHYIINKILYDHYSIFKFVVDEDGETILYYAQLYGVKSKSLPRDVFENIQFDNGLSYSIDFNAAFFEDMKPTILQNFNRLAMDCSYYNNPNMYDIGPYNNMLDRADGRPVRLAYVEEHIMPDGKTKSYKLKWKGVDDH